MHHFPSKAALLAAVLEQEDKSGDGFTGNARVDGVVETVIDIVRRNLDRRELVRMFSIVAAEATHPEHEAHGWLTARYASVVATYAHAIAHDRGVGRISSDRPPEQLASLLISCWEGIQIRWLADGTDPVEGIRVLMEDLLRPEPQPEPEPTE